MVYDVAVIGTGPDPSDPGRDGYAMGYRHGRAYADNADCELVACADIVPENGAAFAEAFDLGADAAYEDYEELLAAVEPDLVSVCVPPGIHADIVVGCAESGRVEAIHCEKPMADTWGDCREMVRACDRADVQLTINHQRRFGAPFRKAKRLIANGEVGTLRRLEFADETLFDAGVHQVDLCQFLTDGTDVDWVAAQVDYREENVWFGTPNATQALVQWRYDDGTFGLATTGDSSPPGACYLRVVGADGVVELGVDDGPTLRYRTDGGAWTAVDTDGENLHGRDSPGYLGAAVGKIRSRLPLVSTADRTAPIFIERAIADAVDGLKRDVEPELSGRNALRATEVIFAAWESARRGGRVDLPLEVEDNPLAAMIDSGRLGPGASESGDAEGAAAERGSTAADGGDGVDGNGGDEGSDEDEGSDADERGGPSESDR
ncbi:Gfo/Idh/MocA family oxidoreductase [Halorubrum sp. 2020YC2]|uniref:Gfo/Idh/MocA family protein n=1 Tax=Halorubrum sp. 2020YC2 TaxID=2836432 RepID=UPI001BEA88EC|nr:Gfo/Idh/MocA family oxidoreductase [Halorubrum sp. 2020YC2]QWC20211.1 Gfo/Idh/MocA family oxidoreductase [Halorubrum sp. 2020YC2]